MGPGRLRRRRVRMSYSCTSHPSLRAYDHMKTFNTRPAEPIRRSQLPKNLNTGVSVPWAQCHRSNAVSTKLRIFSEFTDKCLSELVYLEFSKLSSRANDAPRFNDSLSRL